MENRTFNSTMPLKAADYFGPAAYGDILHMEVMHQSILQDLEGKMIIWAAANDYRMEGYFGYGIDGGIARVQCGKLQPVDGENIRNSSEDQNGFLFYTDPERPVYYRLP